MGEREWQMIWVVLFGALVLRLISLDQSLWLDESINILAVKNNSLWETVTNYARFDFHPPGYFVIIWLWTKIFGYSEIAARLPSVIFGVLTVLIVYHIGKKLYSKSLGLLSAFLLAINPLHIYYSQEARMYSFATFAVCLNTFFFLDYFKTKFSKIGFVLSLILVLSSDYIAYLIVISQLIILIFLKSKNYFKNWLILTIISFLPWILWLPIFVSQINIGIQTAINIPQWRLVVGSASLKALILTFVKFTIGRISHPDNFVYVGLFLPVGVSFIYFLFKTLRFNQSKLKIILFSWLLIPLALAWLVSSIISVYSYFRLLFVLPAFLVIICMGFLIKKSKLANMAFIFLIITQLICSLIYLQSPQFQREDWKGLVVFLRKLPSESKILFESNGSFAPFNYYSKDQIKVSYALKNFPAKDKKDLVDMEEKLGGKGEVFLINYLVEISDPQRLVRKELTKLGYREANVYNFNGVGFVYKFVK